MLQTTTTYQNMALDTLKQKGFRITRPRRLVIELLDSSHVPLSAYDIKDHLDAIEDKVDIVSIYRILECLEQNGLIHRVLGSGKVKKCEIGLEHDCQREQHDHCHHLVICTQCEQVQEVHCPGIDRIQQSVEQASGFRLQTHYLEFMGLCPNCQKC